MNYKFSGKHVIAELYGVSDDKFSESKEIIEIVEKGIIKSGATLIKSIYCSFNNNGFSLVSLLKESHVSLHTYPENNSIFMDVFTCGNIDGMIIVNEINKYFMPRKTETKTIIRGIKDNDF